jgi:hypothetical protein
MVSAQVANNIDFVHLEKMASIGSKPELWYTSLLGHTGIAIAI